MILSIPSKHKSGVISVTVTFSDAAFLDPLLTFDAGVAAIDMFTLKKAGEVVSMLGDDIRLPVLADISVPGVFDDLCSIEVLGSPPMVTATIDTRKMTWNVATGAPTRSVFTDYLGRRYAVKVESWKVAFVGDIACTIMPAKLDNGYSLDVWFAEFPEPFLRSLGFFGLYAEATGITGVVSEHRHDSYLAADWITVPAQQIKWKRKMLEILAINKRVLDDVEQRFYMGLDET